MYRKTTIIIITLIMSMFSVNADAGVKKQKRTVKHHVVDAAFNHKSNNSVECLAKTIYYEARGESDEGKRWVARSVVNRSKHPKFPKDVCSVVSEKHNGVCQFSWVCRPRKISYDESWAESMRVAEETLKSESSNPKLSKILFFHAVSTKPSWGKKYKKIARIDNHIFYGES